jgi:hypothetical protein
MMVEQRNKPVDYFGERIEAPLPHHEPVSNEPTDWRKQHGKVKRLPDQIVDSQGGIGDPWQGYALLDTWERAGRITKEERMAADTFHELFQRAGLSPLRAADMGRTGGSPIPGKHFGHVGAWEAVHAAVAALGGMGSVAGCGVWHVFGCETSIKGWLAREDYRGRAMPPTMAAGVLIGALGSLRVHFGF